MAREHTAHLHKVWDRASSEWNEAYSEKALETLDGLCCWAKKQGNLPHVFY